MYPTLYHLFQDLFGVEWQGLKIVQSFGLMVALAFLAASYTLTLELKRKEGQGLLETIKKKVWKGPAGIQDFAVSGLIGFIVGYKLLALMMDFSTIAENPQDFILSWDGSIFGGILFAALSIGWTYWENKKSEYKERKLVEVTVKPHEHVGTITVIAAVAGILGAKVFHNLEYWEDFMADPWEQLFSFSGLTFYGGLIVAAAAIIYYARKNRINIWHLMDATAPGLILAYAIGRMGCQIAGDGDWGITNLNPMPEWMSFLPEWVWQFRYPHNVVNEGVLIPGCEGRYCRQLAEPAYPTPIYETAMGLVIFGILWGIRKKIKTPGVLFCIYLILTGIERFFIEKIRVDIDYHIFGMLIKQAEIISVVSIIIAILGIWYLKKREKRLQEA